jgi:hypothetical protein
MKCKLCKITVINGIGYQTKEGFICENCMKDFKAIVIKDGKYLVDMEFVDTFLNHKVFFTEE